VIVKCVRSDGSADHHAVCWPRTTVLGLSSSGIFPSGSFLSTIQLLLTFFKVRRFMERTNSFGASATMLRSIVRSSLRYYSGFRTVHQRHRKHGQQFWVERSPDEPEQGEMFKHFGCPETSRPLARNVACVFESIIPKTKPPTSGRNPKSVVTTDHGEKRERRSSRFCSANQMLTSPLRFRK
jgi:hypothetical protein